MAQPRPAKPKAAPRVLVVDDDPLFGRILQAVAERQKIPLTFINSPREAYKKISDLDFDVAIFDYDMGKVTGIQLSRFFEHHGQHPAPVVLVSHYANIERSQWPSSIKDSVSKSIGAISILVQALKAYDRSLQTDGEPTNEVRQSGIDKT
jgi:CheY-like chemotaxis protein